MQKYNKIQIIFYKNTYVKYLYNSFIQYIYKMHVFEKIIWFAIFYLMFVTSFIFFLLFILTIMHL